MLKGGKNIKYVLEIIYTNIISENMCSLSSYINPLKSKDF